MKIVFILPGRGGSGGVRCASIVAQGLLDHGHDVRVLCRKPAGGLRNRARGLHHRMFYADAPDWLSEFSGAVEYFDDITTCRFPEGELIVAFGMASSGLLALLDHVSNPKAQYLHGTTPWDPVLMKQALSLRVPRIAVASYLREIVASFGGGEVSAVVHNGVDCRQYYSSVPESERDGVGLIYSCHIAKDPETALSVVRKLREARPEVPVRVFSSDRRPRQLNQVPYCRYATVQQARDIYSRSLVWIVPSRAEGFSMPVLEAMACGCAVVATDCGGTRDIISEGENGFLAPVGDVDAIIRRVQLALDDEILRTKIRHNAKATAARFTWERCIENLEAALMRVTHQAGARQEEPVVADNS